MSQSRDPAPARRTSASRLQWLVVALVTVVSALVLARQTAGLDLQRLRLALDAIGPAQWLGAALATAASFAALGRYDAIWHRALATGVSPGRARRSGMAAIAIGQTLGMAALTSGFARWRALPDVAPARVAVLTGAVSASFMAAWLPCALLAAAWLGQGGVLPGGPLAATVALAALLVLVGVARRHLPLRDASALLGWSVLDILAAALALWLLLPAPVPYWHLAAAFTLALGAGIVGNSPGGLGPFEVTLLALLPAVPVEDLLAAVLAYRLVYHLGPFLLAAAWLMRPPAVPVAAPPDAPAAWGLARQSGAIRRIGPAVGHVVSPFGLPVAIGDPLAAATRLPAIPVYRASRRLAVAARRAGWQVTRTADEAEIALDRWTLDGGRRKRLRQALRRAADRDVMIRRAEGALPLHHMGRIAAIWERHHGGERGLTLGRFSEPHVAAQEVFLILWSGQIAGFITCEAGRNDWALDLIRYVPGLPDGAVQSAVVAAIAAARDVGAFRFSLGAVPSFAAPLDRYLPDGAGLRLFKHHFAPDWQPRYLASPGPLRHVAAAGALALAIHRPLPRALQRLQHRVADFGFASAPDWEDTRADLPNRTASCPPQPTP